MNIQLDVDIKERTVRVLEGYSECHIRGVFCAFFQMHRGFKLI